MEAQKTQWDEALQSAVKAFKLLTSQSTSKSWKYVPPPNTAAGPGASSGPSSSSTITSSQARAIPNSVNATPSGSFSQRRGESPRKPIPFTTPASTSATSAASSFKGKGREGTADLSSSPLKRSAAGPASAASSAAADPSASAISLASSTSHQFFRPAKVDTHSVRVHRRSGGKAVGLPNGVDVYRAVVDVPFEGVADIQPFKDALSTPEARLRWDQMVDDAETLEMLDPETRISKTSFKLGWPANPRDAVCISRSMSDGNTLISVATSLPRSPDAPSYLRPSPPHVRSHIHLAAWCIQLPDMSADTTDPRIRISLFWSWDLRGAWLGMPPGGLAVHAASMASGLVKFVRAGSSQLPGLSNYSHSIELLSTTFDGSRDTLTTEYCVLAEEAIQGDLQTDPESRAISRRRQRVRNGIEFSLPAEEGWDVKVAVRPQMIEESVPMDFSASAERARRVDGLASSAVLRIDHPSLASADDSERVKVTIQRIVASSDIRLRINDSNYDIKEVEDTGPALASLGDALLNETASLSDISLSTSSSGDAAESRHRPTESITQFSSTKRTQAIASITRRNYIYFTSLLQEPDAKWKHVSEGKGVTITQLDSIDPTLVVYRAEATFVGVGVWDIFAAISSPGTRGFWDKSLEEQALLEEVGDVSGLWHVKSKGAWPVAPRDAVVVETSYKSPSSVHIFSFSTEDRNLFPSIPTPAVGTIRAQIDLRGWSVESLSPTTVHVTLIEQSNPKGWTSKSSSTPSAMTAAVAGVGEYAIKLGGPPVLTRILGASVKDIKYDTEKSTYRLEYGRHDADEDITQDTQNIECELRCDVETWASSLDIVVDPPPINVSCLRRHKLSSGGGGLWLTIEHVAASLEDDTARLNVRRGVSPSARERGSVTVNGARMKVDLDELKEGEVAQLKEKKRTKPQRVPLDLLNGPRRGSVVVGSENSQGAPSVRTDGGSSGVPSRVGTPTPAEGTNQQESTGLPFSDKQPKHPMTPALDVLFLLRRIYAERSPDPAVTPAGWALVSQRNGLFIRKKQMQSISSTVTVQRADKVIQGVTAEDMVTAVSTLGCRKQWDERIDGTRFLESYGDGCTTSFITSVGAFPFRGRGFYLASLTAKADPPSSHVTTPLTSPSTSVAGQGVYYHAAASYPEKASQFSSLRVNPTSLPIGKILIDGWIFETLDPYSSTLNYQIPSTRCTHIVAIDYAGSLPLAVNAMWNATLPKGLLAVETFLKGKGALPAVRAPPTHLQVLGSGRDEDNDFAWVVDNESEKRLTTLLSSNFSASDKRFEVLLTSSPHSKLLIDKVKAKESARRTSTLLNASPLKGISKAFERSAPAPAVTTEPATMTPRAVRPFFDEESLEKKSSDDAIRHSQSISSLRSAATASTRTPRASLRNAFEPRSSREPLVADIEIELKHYPSGYKVEVLSEFAPPAEAAKEPGDAALSADTSKANGEANGDNKREGTNVAALAMDQVARTKKDIPVQVTVYDLPPSAVLAATLDPSLRPRRHLLRLALQHSSKDADDVFSDDKKPQEWRKELEERGGAFRVIVRPIRQEMSAPTVNSTASAAAEAIQTKVEEIDSQNVPVYCSGERLDVVHVNQTSAMLQREHDVDAAVSRLKRVPRKAAEGQIETDASSPDDQLPHSLATPIAICSEMKEAPLKPAPDASVPESKDAATPVENGTTADKATGEKDGAEDTTIKPSNGGVASPPQNGNASTKESAASAASAATAHLMGLLQSYPLSRLGASTAVSTVSASGEGLRQRPVDKGTAADSTSKEGQTSEAAATSGTSIPAVLGGQTLHEARFSLATLLLVAIICFLCGSLVRAMLSPADFIFFPPAPNSSGSDATSEANAAATTAELVAKAAGAAAGELQRAFGGGGEDGVGAGVVQFGQGAVAWRRVLRLLEIKRAIFGKMDLVIAVVDRAM